MLPDMVCGVPVMPVTAIFAQNGSCTVQLEHGSYVAVSYTHLDVYKRQELQIAPVCTALGLPILAGKFLAGGIFQRHRRVGVYDDVRRCV